MLKSELTSDKIFENNLENYVTAMREKLMLSILGIQNIRTTVKVHHELFFNTCYSPFFLEFRCYCKAFWMDYTTDKKTAGPRKYAKIRGNY